MMSKRFLLSLMLLLALALVAAPARAQLGTTLDCTLTSGASTNATLCKAASAKWYGLWMVNSTTTIYYLRLYNLATTPTCSSATGFVISIPIPPGGSAGQAGGIVVDLTVPSSTFTAGLGFCFTGGSGSTDNTNAATGVFGSVRYN
jgi:hypothetical protein